MKHFGLTGINANVQFGKGSGRVKYDTDHFEVRNTADNSLIAVQAASPTNSNDLATKQYVDNAIQGLNVKEAILYSNPSSDSINGITSLLFA